MSKVEKNKSEKSLEGLPEQASQILSRISLAKSLAVIVSLSIVLSLIGVAFNVVAQFRSAQVPEAMELELERLGHIAYQLKSEISVQTPKTFEANPQNFPMSLDTLKLPRFPKNGEIFVSLRNGKRMRVGGTRDAQIWIDMTPFDFPLPSAAPATYYLITTFGTYMGASDEALSVSGKVTNRDIVRDFFKSGVDQNVRILERAEGSVLAGFKTVSGTNLVLFVEKPLVGALAGLNQVLFKILMGAILFSLCVGLLTLAILRLQLSPLAALKKYAAEVSLNKGEAALPQVVMNESSDLSVIAEGMEAMQNQMQASKGMASMAVQYVRILRMYQKSTHEVTDPFDQVSSFVDFSVTVLQPLPQNEVCVVFRDPRPENTNQLLVYTCRQSGGRMALAEQRLTSDRNFMTLFSRHAGASKPAHDELGVHLPLVHQGGAFGIVSFLSYPNALHFKMIDAVLEVAMGQVAERFFLVPEQFNRLSTHLVGVFDAEVESEKSEETEQSEPSLETREVGDFGTQGDDPFAEDSFPAQEDDKSAS